MKHFSFSSSLFFAPRMVYEQAPEKLPANPEAGTEATTSDKYQKTYKLLDDTLKDYASGEAYKDWGLSQEQTARLKKATEDGQQQFQQLKKPQEIEAMGDMESLQSAYLDRANAIFDKFVEEANTGVNENQKEVTNEKAALPDTQAEVPETLSKATVDYNNMSTLYQSQMNIQGFDKTPDHEKLFAAVEKHNTDLGNDLAKIPSEEGKIARLHQAMQQLSVIFEPYNEKIGFYSKAHDALQYAVNRAIERDLASGSMPKLVEGVEREIGIITSVDLKKIPVNAAWDLASGPLKFHIVKASNEFYDVQVTA